MTNPNPTDKLKKIVVKSISEEDLLKIQEYEFYKVYDDMKIVVIKRTFKQMINNVRNEHGVFNDSYKIYYKTKSNNFYDLVWFNVNNENLVCSSESSFLDILAEEQK